MNADFISIAISFLVLERIAQLFFSIKRWIEYRALCRADDTVYLEEMAEMQWAEFSDEAQH